MSQTSPNEDDNKQSEKAEIIAIGIVSGIIVLLIVVIGVMVYRKKRRASLKNDIANLDIEEVTQSDLPNINKTKKENKNGKHKHTSDVLDLEEDNENIGREIIITSVNGQTTNNDCTVNDSDEDDLDSLELCNKNNSEIVVSNISPKQQNLEYDLDSEDSN